MEITSLHGGSGWRPRVSSLEEELGSVWSKCGVSSECGRLRSVLMHSPGPEIEDIQDPAEILFLDRPNLPLAKQQHQKLAEIYAAYGVEVHYLQQNSSAKPNLYFTRDLFAMTPQGAILGRPASAARAGEERPVAETLTRLGVPILLSVYGTGTFEGGDLMIFNADLAFVGEGLRTNSWGANQVVRFLEDLGIDEVVKVPLNYATGHLDEVLVAVNDRQVMLYPTRVPYSIWQMLKRHGFQILHIPDEVEAKSGLALNIVPLEPGVIVTPDVNTATISTLQEAGVECIQVDVSELMKGGGAVRDMTGVIERDPV